MDLRIQRVRNAQEDLLTVQQLHIDSYMIRNLDLDQIDLLGLETTQVDSTAIDMSFVNQREFRNRILLKLDLITQFLEALDYALTSLETVEQQAGS